MSENCLSLYSQFMHDADYNMTGDGICSFACDAVNRLKTVSSNGVTLVTNFYDAKSRRVKKVTSEATTTFFYDGWNLLEERVAYTNGTTSTIHYYWGKDLSGTLQGAGGVGGLLYLTIDDVIYVPAYDNNGSITRYLDANGNTVAQYTYDAFGNSITKSGPIADSFRHRFSTKYYDSETGLYYYGYRFYSPSLMRWLNRDTIGEYGGLNVYSICENNVLCNVDSLGEFKVNYVTSAETSFFERIKTRNKLKEIEARNENDVYVAEKGMNLNGLFSDTMTFVSDCQLDVNLWIWLANDLQDKAKPFDEFIVKPHKTTTDGFSKKKGGGRPMKGATLAHERGHAKAFFEYQKPLFESKIASLISKPRITEREKKVVKMAYLTARRETISHSARLASEAERNWYINNGFKLSNEGGLYVFKRKK